MQNPLVVSEADVAMDDGDVSSEGVVKMQMRIKRLLWIIFWRLLLRMWKLLLKKICLLIQCHFNHCLLLLLPGP
jgi:hypothetical protein